MIANNLESMQANTFGPETSSKFPVLNGSNNQSSPERKTNSGNLLMKLVQQLSNNGFTYFLGQSKGANSLSNYGRDRILKDPSPLLKKANQFVQESSSEPLHKEFKNILKYRLEKN